MSQRASDGTVLGDEGGGTAPEVPTVCPGYTVEFPSPLPPFPEFYRFACLDPDPEKREGIYTRLVSRAGGTERCLQIILYYRVQWLPYHVNDFAPAFLYLDPEGRVQELIYDPGHHRAASVLQPRDLRLTVVAPWHAMRRRAPGPLGRPLRAAQYELRDSVIRAWWFHPNGAAQLKLRSKLVDPWHPGLHARDGGSGTFRDEALCPVCSCPTLMDDMEVHGSDFVRHTRCPGRHRFTALYHANEQRMESTGLA